jgi:hypothetical protein
MLRSPSSLAVVTLNGYHTSHASLQQTLFRFGAPSVRDGY